MLALGWAAARRAPELVDLDVDDLAFIDDTNSGRALVHFKPPPAERLLAGLIVHLAPSDHLESCPVLAARRQVERRQRGPLFVDIHRERNEPGERLQSNVVDALVKHYAEHVLGQNPHHYSGHSLRAGFVQHAREQGMSEREIANATEDSDAGCEDPCETRWKSLSEVSMFEESCR
jgi:integrase